MSTALNIQVGAYFRRSLSAGGSADTLECLECMVTTIKLETIPQIKASKNLQYTLVLSELAQHYQSFKCPHVSNRPAFAFFAHSRSSSRVGSSKTVRPFSLVKRIFRQPSRAFSYKGTRRASRSSPRWLGEIYRNPNSSTKA